MTEERALALLIQGARMFIEQSEGKTAPTPMHAEVRRACKRFIENPSPLNARALMDCSDLLQTLRKGTASA